MSLFNSPFGTIIKRREGRGCRFPCLLGRKDEEKGQKQRRGCHVGPVVIIFLFSLKLSRKYEGREETLYTIFYPKQLFYYVLFYLLLFNQTIGGRDVFLPLEVPFLYSYLLLNFLPLVLIVASSSVRLLTSDSGECIWNFVGHCWGSWGTFLLQSRFRI